MDCVGSLPDFFTQLLSSLRTLGFPVRYVPRRYLAAQFRKPVVKLRVTVPHPPRNFAHRGRWMFVTLERRFQGTLHPIGIEGPASLLGDT
jgi:hypothetical protein